MVSAIRAVLGALLCLVGLHDWHLAYRQHVSCWGEPFDLRAEQCERRRCLGRTYRARVVPGEWPWARAAKDLGVDLEPWQHQVLDRSMSLLPLHGGYRPRSMRGGLPPSSSRRVSDLPRPPRGPGAGSPPRPR